jgi:hypothetical protein
MWQPKSRGSACHAGTLTPVRQMVKIRNRDTRARQINVGLTRRYLFFITTDAVFTIALEALQFKQKLSPAHGYSIPSERTSPSPGLAQQFGYTLSCFGLFSGQGIHIHCIVNIITPI